MSPLVQYGKRAKRTQPDPPQPAPKRQRIAPDPDAPDTDPDTDPDVALVPTRPSSPVASPARPKPKDLSQIFAPLPQLPASPARSPGKSIAKRMLVRARTEPALPAPPTPTLTAAASLPLIPVPDEPRSPPPSPSRPVVKPGVRTYSQSRSFLVALPASTSRAILESNAIDPDEDVRESYSDLRTRWGVDSSEDDPSHVPGIMNEIMSMTELRSKGESRRFLDEVGYLLGGLKEQGMSPSVKRSSAVEIVVKMCDAEFARKARAADFIGRAWDAMTLAGVGADDGDKVLDPCLALFVALVARTRRDIDELAQRDNFFPVMTRLLQTPIDRDGLLLLEDAVARKKGYSKPERLALANLRNLISNKSELFTPTTIPSTRLLSSYSLAALSPAVLPLSLTSPVLHTLLTELALLRASPSPDLTHIEHCLLILDTFLLGAWGGGSDIDDGERDALGRGLVALCARAAKEEQDVQIARRCIESSFRVLINLSHASPEWCALLLRDPAALPAIIPQIYPPPPAVKREDDDDAGASALDRQCLALGLLTNMVFATPDARDRVRELQLPTCPHPTGCTGALECLARLFAHMVTAPKPEPDIPSDLDFFRSHLAALLCLLTAESPRNRRVVRGALSVRVLAGSVEVFLDFYKGLGVHGGAEDGGAMALRVERALGELQGVS